MTNIKKYPFKEVRVKDFYHAVKVIMNTKEINSATMYIPLNNEYNNMEFKHTHIRTITYSGHIVSREFRIKVLENFNYKLPKTKETNRIHTMHQIKKTLNKFGLKVLIKTEKKKKEYRKKQSR